jgi:hypothetical protein
MCMQGGWEAVVLPVFYLCMYSLRASVNWFMRESDRGEVVRRVGVSVTTSRRMCLTATASSRATMCSQPAAGSTRTRASWVLGR